MPDQVKFESEEFHDKGAHQQQGDKWEFNESVASVFDEMLARSIPQYGVMRDTVTSLAAKFVQQHSCVVDLGCSRGEAIAPLVDKFGAHANFVGLEISDPMLEAARRRFAGMINCRVIDIRKHDLRTGLPQGFPGVVSVFLSVLTLQFVPVEHRSNLLGEVYRTLAPGGALLLVEKVLGGCSDSHILFDAVYYDLKRHNGYSQDEIDRKRLALEGVLVPMTASANEAMLYGAGFRTVECFWRWCNFAGWIAIK
jgi:tRNA (cmo5U34)-methyltransferase